MSNYFAEIEEGEINSDDDRDVSKKTSSNLEELSSCEELFASDSLQPDSIGKEKNRIRVSGRRSRGVSQLKMAKPSTRCQRNVLSEDSELERKSRPHKRHTHRQRSDLFSESGTETDRCAKPKRCRKHNQLESVVELPKSSKTSRAKKLVEAPEISCLEKAGPKSSLKRRLMNMMSFTAPVNSEANKPASVLELDHKPVLVTKEERRSKTDENASGIEKTRKRSFSNVKRGVCQDERLQRVEGTVSVDVAVSIKNMAVENEMTNKALNTSVTGDEDLAELRKLALESSVLVASKKQVSGKLVASKKQELGKLAVGKTASATSEETDDLTELRLQALHSAVLKKHIARKARAAAVAASASTAIPTLPGSTPLIPPAALPPALPPAISVGQERQSAHSASWNAHSYQCADNCDKTTLIVDMDLGNTSDEDSQLAEGEDSMQICKDSSPYYVPELWTPIVDSEPDPPNVGCNFLGNNYEEVINIPTTQPTNIPFVQSIYGTQQELNMVPIVTPSQTFHRQAAPNLGPLSKNRQKYSERPNLITLPIVPMHCETNLSATNPTKVNDIKLVSGSRPTNSRSSPLMVIPVTKKSSENVALPQDKSGMNDNGRDNPKWKDRSTSIQGCSPIDCLDSDTENMDIASMIVVDEISCTSPEPESSKGSNHDSLTSFDSSNILTDVPIPSSRYTNRSILPSNAPSFVQTLQINNTPNIIQKQRSSQQNPFILNNLRKEYPGKSGVKDTLSTKRMVSQTHGPKLINQPNLHVVPNQMSLRSNRDTSHNMPTANKGCPGRFVINLGEDSDSEDEGQTMKNPEVFQIPQCSGINEGAHPQNVGINRPTLAFLDAFLKDTRAKFDSKAALMKQQREAYESTRSISPAGLTVNVPEKELGTGLLLPKTSTFFEVRTVSPKVLHLAQRPKKIPAVHSEQNLEQKREAVKFYEDSEPVLSNLKITIDEENRRVQFNESDVESTDVLDESSDTHMKHQEVISPGKVRSVKAQKASADIRGAAKTPKTRITIGNITSIDYKVAKERAVQMPGKSSSANLAAVGSMITSKSSAALPKLSTGFVRTPKTRITLGNTSSPKKTTQVFATTSIAAHAAVGPMTSPALPTSAETVGKHKASIARGSNSRTLHQTTSEKKTVDSAGIKPGVDLTKMKVTKPIVCETSAAVVKPQPLKSCISKTVGLGNPFNRLSLREGEKVLAGFKLASTRIQASEPTSSLPARKKLPLESDAPRLEADKALKRLGSPLPNRKPGKLMRLPLTPPAVSRVNQDQQLREIRNAKHAETKPSQAVTSKTGYGQDLTVQSDKEKLEITEGRLLTERTALLRDLTFILDQLNDSSKVEHAINEMEETILQQEAIIKLAKKSIHMTRERVASELVKRAQTFSLIKEKQKSVSSNRDLCNKLRDQCVHLGSKIKGKSYLAPQPLDAELHMKLKAVATEISKTRNFVSPQKIVPTSNGVGAVESSTARNLFGAMVSGDSDDEEELASINVISPIGCHLGDEILQISEPVCWQVSLAVECPYEVGGICGDVHGCPFVHKKHR